MQYYSRSPKEIHEQSENKNSKETNKKKKISRIILLVDFILIVVVFLYLSNRNTNVNLSQKVNLAKEFKWSGWLIKIDCNFKTTCSLRMTPKANSRLFNKIIWSTKTKTATTNKEIKWGHKRKILEKLFIKPIDASTVINLEIINKKDETELQLIVFP